MVARMTGPDRVSAWTLAQEVGLPESTLGRWLARARREGRVAGRFNEETESEMGSKERPHERSAEEKLRLLRESEGLSEAELGEFLRREGLHAAHLKQWRSAALTALGDRSQRSSKGKPESVRVRELERELSRKEKALAEAAALLILQKKAQSLWGVSEDDDTSSGSGR